MRISSAAVALLGRAGRLATGRSTTGASGRPERAWLELHWLPMTMAVRSTVACPPFDISGVTDCISDTVSCKLNFGGHIGPSRIDRAARGWPPRAGLRQHDRRAARPAAVAGR